MSIDAQTLQKMIDLSCLPLTQAEQPEYQKTLNQLLTVFNALNAVDTTHVKPMSHPFDINQRLRPDTVTEPNQREVLQAIAPHIEQGLYGVPKVIEEPR